MLKNYLITSLTSCENPRLIKEGFSNPDLALLFIPLWCRRHHLQKVKVTCWYAEFAPHSDLTRSRTGHSYPSMKGRPDHKFIQPEFMSAGMLTFTFLADGHAGAVG